MTYGFARSGRCSASSNQCIERVSALMFLLALALITSSCATNAAAAGNNGDALVVSVTPASATLTSGAKQQFTATVTGTSNTAVTWTASPGAIDRNGLYTAPAVQSPVNAVITATSQANSARTALAAATISPNQIQPLQITTAGLQPGQQGSSYSDTLAASGGTQPYSWSVSAGTLPAGLTFKTNGDLTGTPTKQGTFAFSATVTDAKKLTSSASFSMTVSQNSGYDGPAQLPLVTIPITMADSPAPGSVIDVKDGGDLLAALEQVRCGQTIQLQAGATFVGQFKLQPRNCDADHWIIIRTNSPDSALPAEGQRLTPCYAGVASLVGRPAYNCPNPQNVLAKVVMEQNGNGPFLIAPGANFYRLIGLEITRQFGGAARLITTQGTADHIFVDRCWLHGQPQDETYNGVAAAGGTYIAVFDSYFTDFKCIAITGVCTDAHAISGGVTNTQDGPYLIQNNFLEASGEAVMFGGGPATKTPTDITVQYNHFWKPWQWMRGSPNFVGGPDGHPFVVKNHFELKNASRVLVHGNLMENVWGGFTQTGFAILLSPTNQHTKYNGNVCPLCQVTDVTIRYCHISHAGGGLSLATEISPDPIQGAPALAGARWSIHDLVIDDLSRKYFGGGGVFKIANAWPKNPLNNLTINHVTSFPDSQGHVIGIGDFLDTPPMSGFVFTNNLSLAAGPFPLRNIFRDTNSCAAGSVPKKVLENCFTTYTFEANGIIASEAPPSSFPKTNFFPDNTAEVQFVDYNHGNGGNYALQASSPYVNKGTDGKNLGADVAGLNAALAGVE